MWHIYGLASAVHCVLRSVYPQAAQRLSSILNSVVHPRVISDGLLTHTIMWTGTRPMLTSHAWWTPNHFVACLPRQLLYNSDQPSVQALSTPVCAHTSISGCSNIKLDISESPPVTSTEQLQQRMKPYGKTMKQYQTLTTHSKRLSGKYLIYSRSLIYRI